MGKFLTLEEVASLCGIREEKVLELVEKGVIPSYKVAGVYLRFKEEEILSLKDKLKEFQVEDKARSNNVVTTSFFDKIYDFFYFYDYYIFVVITSILLIWYAIH